MVAPDLTRTKPLGSQVLRDCIFELEERGQPYLEGIPLTCFVAPDPHPDGGRPRHLGCEARLCRICCAARPCWVAAAKTHTYTDSSRSRWKCRGPPCSHAWREALVGSTQPRGGPAPGRGRTRFSASQCAGGSSSRGSVV